MKKKTENRPANQETRDLFKKMVPELDNKVGTGLKPVLTSVKKKNVFDMTRVMPRQGGAEALKILSELLSDGTHPLQIMGGLVWFWGKRRDGFQTRPDGIEKFEKGLKTLQAADLNIKRSRLRPDYAIELAVVKLCALLSG